MKRKVLVYSNSELDIKFTDAFAKTLGLDLVRVKNISELSPNYQRSNFSFIGIDSKSDISEVEGMFANASNLRHFLVDANNFEIHKAVYTSSATSNIAFRRASIDETETAAKYYARVNEILLSPEGVSSDSLKKVLDAGAVIKTSRFHDNLQKGLASKATITLLKDKCGERIAAVAAAAADELIMNAMFDAPVNEAGEQIYARMPRTTELKLTPEQAVEFKIGVGAKAIVIAVTDSSGSLKRESIFRHIARGIDSRAAAIRDVSLAGAGLGLALIVKSGGSLLYVSQPGKKTDAVVFFQITEGFREFRNQFQFISSIIIEPETQV